ncbi:hypothetical protein AB0878_46260 [Amycolatopsis sp. NPDC047767]|uniref:hypothetical protein n=1 Tax=Amycolatopsis sp. NPDC047767 TaxID=3156765 RepID=UPI0034563AD2
MLPLNARPRRCGSAPVSWVRSASSGNDHAVTDEQMRQTVLVRMDGWSRGVCGTDFPLDVAHMPPGAECRACLTACLTENLPAVADRIGSATPRGRHRLRRRSWRRRRSAPTSMRMSPTASTRECA